MQTMTPMAMVALVGLGSMVLAAAQAPAPAEIDDSMRYGAPAQAPTSPVLPIKVTLDLDEATGRCAPARLELPTGRDVELQLENKTWREISFAAPDFFAKTRVVEREGGTVIEAASGVLHLSVPPAGMTSIRLRTHNSGAFDYRCFAGDDAEGASRGEIVVARLGT